MKAIILAAGYATRLYPLTKDRPKALLPVKNKPIIDYITDELSTCAAVVNEIIVVSNHRFAEQFHDWAEAKRDGIPITVLDDGTTDESNRKGAIGDIDYCLDERKIDEDVIIIAGDNLFTFRMLDYLRFYNEKNADCICAKPSNDMNFLKRVAVAVTNHNGKVLSLVEKPEEPPSNIAVYASYIYRKQTLPLFKEYIDSGCKIDAPGYFVEWLYKKTDVYVWMMEGECYDIGTPESYEEAQGLELP